MSIRESQLVILAIKQFGHLPNTGKSLLNAIASGTTYSAQIAEANDPKKSTAWNESRTIDASLIRWLCTDQEAMKYIIPHGIDVKGVKISDPLNLSAIKIP